MAVPQKKDLGLSVYATPMTMHGALQASSIPRHTTVQAHLLQPVVWRHRALILVSYLSADSAFAVASGFLCCAAGAATAGSTDSQ